MTLPDGLLVAIVRSTDDEVGQEHLAREWQRGVRRGLEAAERIREQMRQARCTCATPGELAEDGRCFRCWGWPT